MCPSKCYSLRRSCFPCCPDKFHQALVSVTSTPSACTPVRIFVHSVHQASSNGLWSFATMFTLRNGVHRGIEDTVHNKSMRVWCPLVDSGLGTAFCYCRTQHAVQALTPVNRHCDSGLLVDFGGFWIAPLVSKLSRTVVSLDTEADPSLYALSPMNASVWPLCYFVQHLSVKTRV
jgi:hypothetical protein